MSNKPLDPLVIAQLEQVTEDKVSKGEMFTAFDVSRTVQASGVRERHMHMKHVVHDLFEGGKLAGYDRTLLCIEQGKPDAWVYHPLGADPTQYQPNTQPLPSGMTPQNFYQQPGSAGSAGSAGSIGSTGTPSLSSVSFSPTPAQGKYQPDKRGAITVPAKLIKQIGAKGGDVLDVAYQADPNGGSSVLVISTAGNGRKYTVNSSLNIRIKRNTWGAIATGTGKFEFEESHGKIIVKHK